MSKYHFVVHLGTLGIQRNQKMPKKHKTDGKLRMLRTFAESVELAVGPILRALVCVWKLLPSILTPPKLANGT